MAEKTLSIKKFIRVIKILEMFVSFALELSIEMWHFSETPLRT